ncbi:Rpn family recombination-promoting nuclease/putative transposase [Firmicutes bacterium OM07-11]|nr:Rpn family recombination-promoting nuclease/putative transposase [Firmicutes bacterium OM07-11]
MEETRKRKTNKTRKKNNFIMLPTVDFCFKELMQNPKIRQGIIAAILDVSPEEIEETELIPTVLRKEHKEDKFGILDVRVQLKDGTQIDIEMQVSFFEFWANRSIFYLSKMYIDSIKSGEDYDKLKKCIHVSILNNIYFPDDDRCYRKITFCDAKTGEVYSDLMEMHMLELLKLPPEDKNEEGIILWMRFLGGKCEEDFKRMAEKDKYIGEAYEELKHISADEEKRREYEQREKNIRDYNSQMKSATRRGCEIGFKRGLEEGMQEGKEQGIREGKEQGIQEGKRKIILNMSNSGYPLVEIAKITDMTEETVKEILKLNDGKL